MNNDDTKLKRTFMKDEAYDRLRKWIIGGELAPGDKLKDADLSEMLGISRTPVREALLRLENDGLIVSRPNRWTQVAPVNIEETEDVYSIVWTLEAFAVEEAMTHIAETDIQKMEELNEKFNEKVQSGDLAAALEIDNAFHNTFINLSANKELAHILDSLKLKIQRIEIYYFGKVDSQGTSYGEHRRIIEALRSSNVENAKMEVRANWKNSLQRIQDSEE